MYAKSREKINFHGKIKNATNPDLLQCIIPIRYSIQRVVPLETVGTMYIVPHSLLKCKHFQQTFLGILPKIFLTEDFLCLKH